MTETTRATTAALLFTALASACATVVTQEDSTVEVVIDPAPEADAPTGTCTGPSDCTDGPCVDGYCCDGACVGPCEACNLPGTEGTCTAIAAGQDPEEECAEASPGSCGTTGRCDGTGGCEMFGTETACDDGDICTSNDACDGAGACTGLALDCAPGPGNHCCTGSCSATAGCFTEATACDDACGTDRLTTGQTCVGCGAAHAEGLCTGGGVATCTEADHTPCQQVTCDGVIRYCTSAGGTWGWRTAVACDDGDDCTFNDACFGGSCSGTSFTCMSDDCTDRACDGTGDCTETPLDAMTVCGTTECPADSCPGTSHLDYPATCTRTCDGAGTCASCTCSPTPVDCVTGAGNECCVAGCTAGGGCNTTAGSCGTTSDVCTDPHVLQVGSLCTGCGANGASGTCSGGGSFTCNLSTHTPCMSLSCGGTTYFCTNVDGTWRWRPAPACNDEDPCTHGDTCGGTGACTGSTIDCTDTPCMDRECNGTSSCVETPLGPGTACGTTSCPSDSCASGSFTDYPATCTNLCNGAGTCSACTCSASSLTCSDGPLDTCCDVSCSILTGCGTTPGSCAWADACADPNFLIVGKACSGCGANWANGTCTGGTAMECSASMHTPCTTTICNTATYRCTNVGGAWQWGSSTTCDDSDLCTYNDVCSGSTCAGTPIICADEACTDSECNGTASCTVTYPSGTTCSDSDPCTTGETCNGAGSCTGGTPAASCGDGSCNCGETISTCPADCTPVCVLPRTLASWEGSAEGWSTSGNWTLQGSGGSTGGYMNFDDATPSHLTDYSHALRSPVMDLGGCTAVSLRYKIKLSDYLESSWSNDEHLRVQCSGNGSAWTTLRTFTDGDDYSDMSFGWTQYTHALPIECKTTTAYIRFLAEGDDSWDIWYWGIDTVSLEP